MEVRISRSVSEGNFEITRVNCNKKSFIFIYYNTKIVKVCNFIVYDRNI